MSPEDYLLNQRDSMMN